MRKLLFFVSIFFFLISACQTNVGIEKIPEGFVLIEGGVFRNQKSNLYGKNAFISDFYLAKYEVTQKEWTEIMGTNPSQFRGDHLPVEMVSWYDCVEYCNLRSLVEGLNPYYNINKGKRDQYNISIYDSIKWVVTSNIGANGYRLPTEAEWEYAASGGRMSENYTFSGSNEIADVAWYWRNCGDKMLTRDWNYNVLEQNQCRTRLVGSKTPNELGLYDMSGNVREWCEDWYEDYENPIGLFRSQRGGGWIGLEQFTMFNHRGSFEANGIGPDQGFRLCRNK